MNWASVPLRVVAPAGRAEREFAPEEIVWHLNLDQIESQSGRILSKQRASASSAGNSTFTFDEGNVLYSKLRPYLNKVVRPDEPGIGTTELVPLRPVRGVLEPDFLKFYLRSDRFLGFANSVVAGAKMPRMIMDKFWEHRIPLPPPKEQGRIVELLEQADGLRRKRTEADTLADRILSALFHKMFGDPATNPKGFPTGRLRDLAIRYSDGPFGSNLKSEHYVEKGVRVVRLQNIGAGKFLDEDKAFIASDHFTELAKHECKPGDVLIGTLGDPNLRACIQPAFLRVALNKADCVQFRPHSDRCTAEYACWLLNSRSTLAMARGLIVGQTRPRISMGRLGELVVPEPPLHLQRQFSALVRVYEPALAKMQEATPEIERLFSAMLHRAFTGELTAKWREAHLKELLAEMEQQARVLNLPLEQEAFV